MQQQFFELAAKEAQRIKTRLLEDQEKLKNISRSIKFAEVPNNDEWRNWRICVVDGSDSPIMSERNGGRFGTYGVTYHIFQGLELVDEEYFGGEIVDVQVGDPEASDKMLSLLTTALERDVAVSCLEKDIDLLLIDGSFFGFRPRCRIIHPKKVPGKESVSGLQLVKRLVSSSTRLLDSGKAVGIIKRVQTGAIDGWTIYQSGNDKLVLGRNDKEILASLMREGHWFSYESLFGDPAIFNYLTRLALAYDRYGSDAARGFESIFKACKGDVDRNVRRDLLCEPDQIFRTSRHFIRCSFPAPPFCFETSIGYDPRNLLAFFMASCNKATGLPLQLDLTDQDVTIPRGFTKEFVEEIEAHLVKDPELDKYDVGNHFSSLNPQKSE
jgi:hypothetical protein